MSENKLLDAGEAAKHVVGHHNVVLVGLMGAGKSVIGRLLSQYMNLPFVDTDDEIVDAARMSISELFKAYGEPEFRALEARVVKRILQKGPTIISTGGGAFINDETRTNICQSALSVWLKADFDVLWPRVSKRSTRPLLQRENPQQVLKDLMKVRYPVYQEADLTVTSRNVSKQQIVLETLQAIEQSGDILKTKSEVN